MTANLMAAAGGPQPLAVSDETASTAVAAQATAMVQSRYVMARANPRNLEQVRVDLLKECKRPGFAETAKYRLPFGDGVTGPSIRFAEAAFRCLSNIWCDAMTVFDSEEKRIIKITVTDLESNVAYDKSITISKTVERKKLRQGQNAISTRVNSYGQTVYRVEATESEVTAKEGAEISKAIRTLGLRHLPGDIYDAAMAEIDETASRGVKEDPKGALRNLVDAFAAIGVEPTDLVSYLRHAIEQTTPAEIVTLRALYTALKEGQVTWREVILDTYAPEKETEGGQLKTSAVKEALEARRKETAKETQAKQAEQQELKEKYKDVGPPPMEDVDDEDPGAGF